MPNRIAEVGAFAHPTHNIEHKSFPEEGDKDCAERKTSKLPHREFVECGKGWCSPRLHRESHYHKREQQRPDKARKELYILYLGSKEWRIRIVTLLAEIGRYEVAKDGRVVYRYKYKEQSNRRRSNLIVDAQRGDTRQSLSANLLYKLVIRSEQLLCRDYILNLLLHLLHLFERSLTENAPVSSICAGCPAW